MSQPISFPFKKNNINYLIFTKLIEHITLSRSATLVLAILVSNKI
jgi:hypothetical protein